MQLRRRKGKFTVADLAGLIVLTFILAVFWPVLTGAIGAAWTDANILTKAALSVILPAVVFAVLGKILVSTEPEHQEIPMQRRPRR